MKVYGCAQKETEVSRLAMLVLALECEYADPEARSVIVVSNPEYGRQGANPPPLLPCNA